MCWEGCGSTGGKGHHRRGKVVYIELKEGEGYNSVSKIMTVNVDKIAVS